MNADSIPTSTDIIARIQSLDINFLAIDFDLTFIDKHSGGRHTGTVHELIPHVRPIIVDLITSALQTGTIHVAIVTYSKQAKLIRSLLESVFGIDMATKIVIRGSDKSWKYEGQGCKEGKQPHMASAVEEILHNLLNHDNVIENHATTTSGSDNDNRNHNTSTTTTTATTTAASTTITTNTNTNTNTIEITKRTTILIDDDDRNIRIALKDGTRAVWFNPKQPPEELYINLMNLV
jgi:hypothetical protein